MANRGKRTMNPAQQGLSIETEIERSRETEKWERLIELAEQLRAKPDKHFSVLADFLIGEAKLEEHLKNQTLYANVPRGGLIEEAEKYLSKTTGEDAKRLGVHLDSYILLGKLHFSLGEYAESLQFYDKAQIDSLEEKQLPPRSLKIMAEAFAIKAMCMEKTASFAKVKAADREAAIIRCYEMSSDLTLLFLQVADKAAAAAGQSTWSVASGGTTGSVSPIPAEEFRPKMGIILESSLYQAAVLNINQGRPLKAITRLRQMLVAEETESTKEIRRNVCCQLAEVLISNCSSVKYVRPDLDVVSSAGPKRASRNAYSSTVVANSSGFGAESTNNPWKPVKHCGVNLFTPRNKYEELILVLLLSEFIANKEAVLSQGPGSATSRKTTFEAATVTYDLLTLTLSRFGSFRLLSDMLERSMKFSYQEKHTWEQFALVLNAEGRYFRSLMVIREISQRCSMEVGTLISTAKLCYEKLGLYDEGIQWASKALETREAQNNKTIAARCYVFTGIGHLIRSRRVENLQDRNKSLAKAGQFFERASELDKLDHLAEFYLAFYKASIRKMKEATSHVKNALTLNPYHLPSLHLMILMLSANKEYQEALEMAENTLEEFSDNFTIMLLKVKLEELIYGSEHALLSVKDMLQHWQDVIDQSIEDEGLAADLDGHLNPLWTFGSQFFKQDYYLQENTMSDVYRNQLDAMSFERDSVSIHANSVTASQLEKTLSEVAASSTVVAHFPQKPNPNDPFHSLMRIWLVAAELYLGCGDVGSAESCVNEAKGLSTLSYLVIHMKGLILEEKGCLEEARQAYENALAVNPAHLESLHHLGRVYFKLGLYRLAEKSVLNAIRLEPNSEHLWTLLGQILEAIGGQFLEEVKFFEVSDNGTTLPGDDFMGIVGETATRNSFVGSEIGADCSPDGSGYKNYLDHILNAGGINGTMLADVLMAQQDPRVFYVFENDEAVPKLFAPEDEYTPTSDTIGCFVTEAAKMAAKAAECHAVAISVHNHGPIMPVSSVPLPFE